MCKQNNKIERIKHTTKFTGKTFRKVGNLTQSQDTCETSALISCQITVSPKSLRYQVVSQQFISRQQTLMNFLQKSSIYTGLQFKLPAKWFSLGFELLPSLFSLVVLSSSGMVLTTVKIFDYDQPEPTSFSLNQLAKGSNRVLKISSFSNSPPIQQTYNTTGEVPG